MNGTSDTEKNITQRGNRAGGHISGNDIIDVHGDYINQSAPVIPESKLSKLYRRLKDEAADDQQLLDYIDQLAIYTRVVQDEEVIGLDGKLTAADRSDQIEMAMRMKEQVYAQIRQTIFSRTCQTIYATLMAKIWEEFTSYVRPAITGGASRAEVDALINKHVIKPITAELDNCIEYDGIANTEVRGMLYFLTGNCHLRWD